MKTKNNMANADTGKRFTITAIGILLLSSLLYNTASAQRERDGGERHGGERNATFRSDGMRQNNRGYQQVPANNRRPDVAMERNNNRSGNFNRYQNPGNTNRAFGRARNIARDNNANFNRPGNNNAPRYRNNNRPFANSASRPAYRPVDGNNRRPVYSRYNPSWRYGYLPRRNSYFNSVPQSYLSINFGGLGYRYWDGVFYRPLNNIFSVCTPPVGIYINTLPVGYSRIYVHNNPYYYYNGTYYNQRGSTYYVVSPPVGALVESLPEGYETLVTDGETYYVVDGAQYKPVLQDNGEIWYQVTKAN